MRQKLFIFLAFLLLILVFVGLNAASYKQQEKKPDNEYDPNRSSYNGGVTGTRAFYDLLSETGRKVVRWQESTDALLANKNAPKTFVVIGSLRREFTEQEIRNLLQWVSYGGRLVVIDRNPAAELTKTTADWNISVSNSTNPQIFNSDINDQNQMTNQVDAVKPLQPTVYTQKINAVQPSIFAGSVNFQLLNEEEAEARRKKFTGIGSGQSAPPPPPPPAVKSSPAPDDDDDDYSNTEPAATPAIKELPTRFKVKPKDIKTATENPVIVAANESYPPAFTAPVVHLGTTQKNLLVDVPYDSGEIVFLSDPFIVSNSGIRLADNAQLGINIVSTGGDGAIAFDEYHQGFGSNSNRFFEYFAGTPVIPIFVQLALLIGLLFFSQSRRFARAVPEPEINRLSKLEYVSAMAELQQRTHAYDLAIENIYTDFRRRAARCVGADNQTTSTEEMARLIAERIKIDRAELEDLMRKCEDIMHGEPTGKKETVRLAGRLREVEEALGLRRGAKTKI